MKFVCKWCNKKYPCGKSLGGHIRIHKMFQHESAKSQKKYDAHLKKVCSLSNELGGHSSYGLRENPKKTLKAVETISRYPTFEKFCKQCGKGFQSMKALSGHVAVHTEKDKVLKDDNSWTSESVKTVMDSDSDTVSEEIILQGKRIMINSSFMSSGNDSSSITEIDEQKQEELAMCLMKLSRDSSRWGGVNSVVESSDNNYVVLETKPSSNEIRIGSNQVPNFANTQYEKKDCKNAEFSQLDAEDVEEENSDSGYYLSEHIKYESNGSVDRYYKDAAFFESKRPKVRVEAKDVGRIGKSRESGNANPGLMSKLEKYEQRKKNNESYHEEDLEVLDEPCKEVKNGSLNAELPKSGHKKRKFECENCKRIFSSYQALGGHRPCHKRTNAFYGSTYESGENSLESQDDPYMNERKLRESLSKKKANAKVISRKVEKMVSSKETKAHECPYCHRMFKNGQALGGHKRSHFIGGTYVGNRNQAPMFKNEHTDLLDLNLPAPMEDDVDVDFVSW